jgi:serine/threonine protein kinase
MPLSVGTRLGPYEILAPIGAGGMGEVYRARDGRLGREVALKILPAAFASDGDRVRRFEQEGRAAAALNHPNIVVIYEAGSQDGVFFVATELLDGETLRERLAGHALPVRKAIDYAIQIDRGLAAAHARSITHRDLKPWDYTRSISSCLLTRARASRKWMSRKTESRKSDAIASRELILIRDRAFTIKRATLSGEGYVAIRRELEA